MLNPLDAPAAVAAAAEPLEELLDDCNHVSSVELCHVVPVAGTAPGRGWMRSLAQAVYDAGSTGYRVGTRVEPFESPGAWRDILRRQVTEGYMQPTRKWANPSLRTPDEIRRTGELADGVADLIEAHLGPVLSSGDVDGPHLGEMWGRHLLLVSSEWATILYFGIHD
ncbi:hypothetical protein ABZW03_16030 [Kitasatospora sp. NPDC004799]|uniref:hypothetical protein n=1 Tax=Kitasatospora sp. NPDC004799 TaxID=3154460 RepID=UPI00339DB268